MSSLTVQDHYTQGNLQEAIKLAAEQVKSHPGDEFVRTYFIELLCVNNEFERADRQLTALISLKPELALVLSTWRQLVHAAQKRQDVFLLKDKPDLIENPTLSVTTALELLIAINEKDQSNINSLVEETNRLSEQSRLSINNSKGILFRDLDDVTANLMEVLATNGKYFWVDFSQIVSLDVHAPSRLIENLWRKANITLTNGTEGEVYIPAVYANSKSHLSLLGRETSWVQSFDACIGEGLKLWLCNDEEITINELSKIENSEQKINEEMTV